MVDRPVGQASESRFAAQELWGPVYGLMNISLAFKLKYRGSFKPFNIVKANFYGNQLIPSIV